MQFSCRKLRSGEVRFDTRSSTPRLKGCVISQSGCSATVAQHWKRRAATLLRVPAPAENDVRRSFSLEHLVFMNFNVFITIFDGRQFDIVFSQ